ncbi:MAG: DUF6624 domain-containing protein [Bacteroidota bacterium]
MIQLIKFLLAVVASQACIAQSAISEANKFRKEGKLEAAIEAYKVVHQSNPKDWKNTYNLACAYALSIQKDSAFHYLNIALKDDRSLWALADSDLYALIEDPRWQVMADHQMERHQNHHGTLEQPKVAMQWLRIILKDQALDYYIDQAKSEYMRSGMIPQWYHPLGMFKEKITKDNYQQMQELIEAYGWPKYSRVGKLAADAPLLVINHHEDEAVRIKYLSQIRQNCLDKEGSCMEYAKIQDRVLVNTNKPQLYGMQFRYAPNRTLEPFPIKDSKQVDQRRKEIGLEPLKDYLKRKIDYDFKVEQEDGK